ncbi:hypothetical protein, partial [Paracoccus rhizosphaerae]|uniref:hypothetical protein n=1 Tax=Paracoccus rhizosphaerae TaxID=1133347 RepID=UPI00223FC709
RSSIPKFSPEMQSHPLRRPGPSSVPAFGEAVFRETKTRVQGKNRRGKEKIASRRRAACFSAICLLRSIPTPFLHQPGTQLKDSKTNDIILTMIPLARFLKGC